MDREIPNVEEQDPRLQEVIEEVSRSTDIVIRQANDDLRIWNASFNIQDIKTKSYPRNHAASVTLDVNLDMMSPRGYFSDEDVSRLNDIIENVMAAIIEDISDLYQPGMTFTWKYAGTETEIKTGSFARGWYQDNIPLGFRIVFFFDRA